MKTLRSLLFLLACVVGVCQPLEAAYALAAHGSAILAANGGTTTTFNTGACDLLIVGVSFQNGVTVTLTDSKSNTWHAFSPGSQTVGGNVQYIYAWNATCGAAHTFTLSGNGQFSALTWQSWAGSQTSSDPRDVDNGAGTTSNVSSLQPGSVNTAAGELIFTAIANGADVSSNDRSIDSSFTVTDQVPYQPGNNYPAASAYKIQTGASENPTWSWSSGATLDVNAVIVTFKPAGAPGCSQRPALLLLGVGNCGG